MTSTEPHTVRPPAPRAGGRKRPVVPDEVLHTLTDGLLVLTPAGRVVQANDSAFAMLGATPGLRQAFASAAFAAADDLIGADARSLLTDAGAVTATGRPLRVDQDPIRACLATGVTTTTRIGLPQLDGGVHWVSARVRPVRTTRSAATVDPARDLVDAVIVVLTESTTDEAVLVALRDRDHQLSVAQRMAHLSMWRWDTTTGGVTWLDGNDRDTGTPGQQRSMADYLDGIHPDDRPLHDKLMADLLRGAPSGELDLRYRTTGGWLHWHLWAESVVDADGVVTALWGTTQEVTERREAEAAVRRLSMTDSLTELANRAQVLERLGAALVARAAGDQVGLVLLDIDRFRHVNDRYGPSAGDLLLIQVGRRLRRLSSGGVTAGRLGSDQFALVLDQATPASAAELARAAFTALSAPFELAGVSEPVHITVSVGTAVSPHASPPSAGELFRQGEIAMSYAHSAGGCGVVFFDEALRAQVGGRLDMDGRLRAALISGDLFPVFQPVFTLGSDRHRDRVTSCEALARMTGPSGMIAPSDFIPVAEESGLIVELDLAVIDQAVQAILLQPPLPGFRLAANLSPLSLQVPGLLGRLTSVLDGHGLDARSLNIEITESCLAEPTPVLLNNLQGLRELGARIGLDDFGTGYSALGYLSRFDLDFMKIDRSFVSDVCEDPRARAIVRAVIDLAHAHDLTVVAEGIETAEQLETLRGMRCDTVQGFHLGRPMSVEALGELSQRHAG